MSNPDLHESSLPRRRAPIRWRELALDLRWSWNHSTDELWGRLDPELWELTQNPWVVLQTVSQEKLQQRLADPGFPQPRGRTSAAREARIGSSALVSEDASGFAAQAGRVLQHGIHAERSAADLFGRPGQRGRRSAQGGQRSGRAGGRRSGCCISRATSARRSTRRARSWRSIRSTIPGSCRSGRCAMRTANGCG